MCANQFTVDGRRRLMILGVLTLLGLTGVNPCALASLKFVVAGDPQIGWDSGPIVDEQRFIALAHISNHLAVNFVLLAGDMVQHGSTQEWSMFDQARAEFHVPVYATRGNHDDLVQWQTRFGLTNYVITAGTTSIVVLDSNTIAEVASNPDSQAQWNWLQTTLPVLAQTSQHIFMLMHHPPFLTSETEPGSTWNWAVPQRAQLLALAHQYGVQDIFTGHVHANVQVSTADGSLTVYTTAGTAGTLPNGDAHLAYRLFQIDDSGVMTQQLIYDLTDPGPGPLLGDVNADGAVNALDIAPFIQVVTGVTPYNTLADMNQDGAVNALDISGFINAVTGGGATSSTAVPEPATLIAVNAGILLLLRRARAEV